MLGSRRAIVLRGLALRWLNEPKLWTQGGDGTMTVVAEGGTDFWRRTHYGYTRASGHVCGETHSGDATISLQVEGGYEAQYDQAGIMLWIDDEHWLKAGVELYERQLRLSTVVTVGYSNWSFSTLPVDTRTVWLRARRSQEAVEVHSSLDGRAYELTSLVYLPADRPALLGAMCAAPVGAGFTATFRDLTIAGGS